MTKPVELHATIAVHFDERLHPDEAKVVMWDIVDALSGVRARYSWIKFETTGD